MWWWSESRIFSNFKVLHHVFFIPSRSGGFGAGDREANAGMALPFLVIAMIPEDTRPTGTRGFIVLKLVGILRINLRIPVD